jgi:ribosomal protein S27E
MDDAAADDLVVDGNAIGGMLMEVFGAEMTTTVVTCDNCGAVSQVAELAVYRPGLGTVVRCRSCESVLMVFATVRGVTCVDLMGVASMT